MSMIARVDDGRVVELLETDRAASTLFHPSLIWKRVDPAMAARVALNWIVADGTLTPPPPAPPAEPAVTLASLQAQVAALAAAVAALAPAK
jgi:hypothetical protein